MRQAETPRDLPGLGNADAWTGYDRQAFAGGAGQELEGEGADWQPVMFTCYAEGLAYPPGTRTKQALVCNAAPGLHDFQPCHRFKRADKDARAVTLRPAHEVEAPVDSIGAVNVGVAGRTEHDLVSPGWPAEAVGSRIFMIIRLHLDDAPTDAVDQQDCPDQGLRHFERRRMKIDGWRYGVPCVHSDNFIRESGMLCNRA